MPIGTTMDGIVVGTAAGIYDSKAKLIAGGDTRSFAMFHGETYAAVVGRGVMTLPA